MCLFLLLTKVNIKLQNKIIRLRKLIGRLYVDLTGQSAATIARDLDRDKFLSARDAREYGLVDLVASNDSNQM